MTEFACPRCESVERKPVGMPAIEQAESYNKTPKVPESVDH